MASTDLAGAGETVQVGLAAADGYTLEVQLAATGEGVGELARWDGSGRVETAAAICSGI